MTFPRVEHPIIAQTVVSGERKGRPACFDCGRGRGWQDSYIGRMATCRRGEPGKPHQHRCRRCYERLPEWEQVVYLPENLSEKLYSSSEKTEAGKPTPGNPAGFGPHLLRYFAEIGARA